MRVHKTSLDVSVDDPVSLTQILIQINSANPSLGTVRGPGETAIAHYVAAWLEHRGIECHWIEPTSGRPSVIGVVRGSGGGKSLMLNGHLDTVTLSGYEHDPLSGTIRDGKIFGRGSADMKAGVAANMIALANAQRLGLRGDVIFTGVADEEADSIGTKQVLQAGWRADAAIVSEPTDLAVVYAHKGYVLFEVDIHGVAAHGGFTNLGIDAILKTGHFLVALDRYAQWLEKFGRQSPAGPPSVHTSTIKGGEEWSTYPALCTVQLERRMVGGETVESVRHEMQELLDKVASEVPDFKFDLKFVLSRPPFEFPLDHPFTTLVGRVVGDTLGKKPEFCGDPSWNDSALLAEAGISTLLWGPLYGGAHGNEEWVDVESVHSLAKGLTRIAHEFCG